MTCVYKHKCEVLFNCISYFFEFSAYCILLAGIIPYY